MSTSPASTETDRVRRYTATGTLHEIDERIAESIRFFAMQPEATISRRITELECEWSMERWLETNASALAFCGTLLGLTISRKWLALPLIVTGFLFQHAVQGWCPPVPVLREMGVRTRGEIDREKYALKILRGDFKDVDFDRLQQARQSAAGVTEAVAA
ncbi:MAG TPA: hypothetical protein VF988_01275 [Verrucomicrobiae bacterium]